MTVSSKQQIKRSGFPIVAIGASAGGLEAMSQLLMHLPVNTGMTYIYVQHLSPDHKSLLTDILSKITKMQVLEITDMEHMVPDTVYVIPYNKGIKVTDGHIKLLPRSKAGAAISIDVLFTSLAETHKENVIGIILSGNAHDGTMGIKTIKEAGGLTFVQDDSAQAKSMPHSAIASGMIDYVLSPKEIALKLADLYQNGFLKRKKTKTGIQNQHTDLKTIFDLLYKKHNVDFSYYKIATIKRRLNSRMLQAGVQSTKEYIIKHLQREGPELDLLYKDLLINVSSFFRDEETFTYLKATFLPRLLKSKKGNETIRIWVPACSRGEEVYSIAMLITELQTEHRTKIPVQIFATDLSESVIRDARSGKYLHSDMVSVTPKRIKRFFIHSGEEYTIIKEIREMCVCAPHNILRDPPFIRIDFVSCRNLLIYFDDAAQKKTLEIIHFALKDGGYLMLGKAETIGKSSQLFVQKNNKFKIYTRNANLGMRKAPQLTPHFPGGAMHEKSSKQRVQKQVAKNTKELDSTIDHVLLERYMPACAVINKEMEILQFRGPVSLYLSHPSGKASLNILKMIRPECAFDLRDAILQVIKTNQSVYKSDIEMEHESSIACMSIEVSPVPIQEDDFLLLIVFTQQAQTEKHTDAKAAKKSSSEQKDLKIKRLSYELNRVRAEVLSVIESQDKAYEELQIANEEIVSANEEFQTLNEELETSKEEIEATNEELISTNQELKVHNVLLAESYAYSQVIIETIHEPMIILDGQLHVKSANKSFYKKFLVHAAETEGVSLFELGNSQWNIPELRSLLLGMLSKNDHFENFVVTHTFPQLGEKVMRLNAGRIIQKVHREKLILLAIEDITELTYFYSQEKERLKNTIIIHEADKLVLEKAVLKRTKQLNEMNIELENANKDLTSFTYLSSHDLQEPLRKIRTFVSRLIEEEIGTISENGKRYLQRTLHTAERMQALIEDLLIYTSAKNPERRFEKTDLNMLLEEIKQNFMEEILEKHATIKFTGQCTVSIIRFQFRQLLQNLLSNSLKFSRENTAPEITIKTTFLSGSKSKNPLLKATINYCHIVYTDNGIGFSADYNERIFNVFQRLHNHVKYKGTGMGLAICKRIVENHAGIITASGELNKGVKFDIYIPIEQ